MSKLPNDPAKFVDALAAIAQRRKSAELLTILDAADAEYVHQAEDWGVTYYSLSLVIPWDLYSALADPDATEKSLSDMASTASKGVTEEACNQVNISHKFDAPNNWRTGARPLAITAADHERIWKKPGWFRLFLSHKSTIKKEVHELRQALAIRYVDAFVAHDDIEPSRAWQREIELALASCHALAALASDGFHESVFCMQEIGWALGRGILVLPVQLPHDPQGFINETQGLKGRVTSLSDIRDPLINVLAANAKTTKQMHEPLVMSLERKTHPDAVKIVIDTLDRLQALSEDHARRLLAATKTNAFLKTAKNEVKRVEAIVAKFGVPTEPAIAEDEYDPFADS